MTEIYLIRHTQAEGNRYRMMQGFWDGAVTELGLRQAKSLGRRFAAVPLDAVYSSDLSRAVLTAEAVAGNRGLAVQKRTALRELNIGPWEQKFFGNLCQESPELTERFLHDSENWVLPGAETFAQVRERGLRELTRIAEENNGRTVAVVSHGATVRCMLSGITGIPLSDAGRLPICKNTAVTKLQYEDGRFQVEYFNDDSHLAADEHSSWNTTGDLRDAPFDLEHGRARYEACYADAWRAAHGTLRGFHARTYYDAACRHQAAAPGAVMRIYLREEPVGLVDLDPLRGKDEGIGWVSLLYLKESFRNLGYGIQLLGRAVFFYSDRDCLRLQVAEENRAALRFYTREGFGTVDAQPSQNGALLTLEKKLRHSGMPPQNLPCSGMPPAAGTVGGPYHV